jgi:hypothetical protein
MRYMFYITVSSYDYFVLGTVYISISVSCQAMFILKKIELKYRGTKVSTLGKTHEYGKGGAQI